VSDALTASDTGAMLEIVGELERTGQNLQHYCRELSRFFRNLLVAKIAGPNTRLIAASAAEQERLSGIAASFTEDDLTRFLQLTLETFRELQYSLQPRFHLEIGLLRLVHAGRMTSIEGALSQLGPAPAMPSKPAAPPRTAPPPPPAARKAVPQPAAAPTPEPDPPGGESNRERLHALLTRQGHTFSADGVEHSELVETRGEWRFTTPAEFRMAVQSPEVEAAARQIAGRPVKIVVQVGEVTAAPAAAKPAATEADAAQRALRHPEVKHFQELFPGSTVRTVRNLKE
jgi:DNA polymerase-3 subunit gamma/tau